MWRAGTLTIALCLFLGACGTSNVSSNGTEGAATVPGNADPADVAVIQDWIAALDRNDIAAAAGYFAIPSEAENGVLIPIRNVADARLFNASLPCGAHVIRAVSVGKFTTATFSLTERPGPGACGPGTGGRAQTSFVITDGKITEWRRVGAGSTGPATPSQST